MSQAAAQLKDPQALYRDGTLDTLGVDDGALAEYGFAALNRRLDLIGYR